MMPVLVPPPDALMVMVAIALTVTPFSVAFTVRTTVPGEFPAVNEAVGEESSPEETLPSVLLSVQEYVVPEGQLALLPSLVVQASDAVKVACVPVETLSQDGEREVPLSVTDNVTVMTAELSRVT
jgi:hypothetical protein